MRPGKAYYTALKVKAAILYIKNGLSAAQISEQTGVSMSSLHKWRIAGKWDDYRPDTNQVKEYKAADLYINKGMSKAEIAMKLSVKEDLINCWVVVNGWDAARLLSQSHDKFTEVVNSFCSFYEKIFPKHSPDIQIVKTKYLKKMLNPKTVRDTVTNKINISN